MAMDTIYNRNRNQAIGLIASSDKPLMKGRKPCIKRALFYAGLNETYEKKAPK
jgi:hypothetical protein